MDNELFSLWIWAWGVTVKWVVWRGIVDNYRHFNCFRSLDYRSPAWGETGGKWRFAEASKIPCPELLLCVLGSFLSDQRIKGVDIIFQTKTSPVPAPRTPLCWWEIPGRAASCVCPAGVNSCRDIVTEPSSPPLAPAWLPRGGKVPPSVAWEKQQPAEHPHLQIFLHDNKFWVKITEFSFWSKSRQQLELPLSLIQTTHS